jgi:predicted nucleotidyltransferase
MKYANFKFEMKKQNKILESIIGITSSQHPGSEIYLFGSCARGDFELWSDWDLLILIDSENITFDQETRLMDKLYELELESGELISPLIYVKSDWNEKYCFSPLFENIQNDGIRIK